MIHLYTQLCPEAACIKTCLSYASNAAAAVGYNQTFNCNFAAVSRGVDRNWIVATIEEAHDYDCPTKTVGKNQASALARERETTVSAAEAPGATV